MCRARKEGRHVTKGQGLLQQPLWRRSKDGQTETRWSAKMEKLKKALKTNRNEPRWSKVLYRAHLLAATSRSVCVCVCV
jgi:hypothetical protein